MKTEWWIETMLDQKCSDHHYCRSQYMSFLTTCNCDRASQAWRFCRYLIDMWRSVSLFHKEIDRIEALSFDELMIIQRCKFFFHQCSLFFFAIALTSCSSSKTTTSREIKFLKFIAIFRSQHSIKNHLIAQIYIFYWTLNHKSCFDIYIVVMSRHDRVEWSKLSLNLSKDASQIRITLQAVFKDIRKTLDDSSQNSQRILKDIFVRFQIIFNRYCQRRDEKSNLNNFFQLIKWSDTHIEQLQMTMTTI